MAHGLHLGSSVAAYSIMRSVAFSHLGRAGGGNRGGVEGRALYFKAGGRGSYTIQQWWKSDRVNEVVPLGSRGTEGQGVGQQLHQRQQQQQQPQQLRQGAINSCGV